MVICQVHEGSWFAALKGLEGSLAGILSNPPYIEPEVVPTLQVPSRALSKYHFTLGDDVFDLCTCKD